jgi:hypothetical protein
MMYLNNILQIGDLSIFTKRFISTVPMHIFTGTLMYLFISINKFLSIPALFLAILIHYAFNYFI